MEYPYGKRMVKSNIHRKEQNAENSLDITVFLVVPVVTSATKLFAIGEGHDVAGAIVQTVGFVVTADGCKSARARADARSAIAWLRLWNWRGRLLRLGADARGQDLTNGTALAASRICRIVLTSWATLPKYWFGD